MFFIILNPYCVINLDNLEIPVSLSTLTTIGAPKSLSVVKVSTNSLSPYSTLKTPPQTQKKSSTLTTTGVPRSLSIVKVSTNSLSPYSTLKTSPQTQKNSPASKETTQVGLKAFISR